MKARRGLLVALVAPSGGGKTTMIERLRASDPRLKYSVSATTRPRRVGERDGRDYRFLSAGEFVRRRAAGEFVETANVHGYLYGTLKSVVRAALYRGHTLLLDVDVQGARALSKAFSEAVSVFLMPPSWRELVRRIRRRAADSSEDTRTRIENAAAEIARAHTFDYVVVNDELDRAVDEVACIIKAERCRATRPPGRTRFRGRNG